MAVITLDDAEVLAAIDRAVRLLARPKPLLAGIGDVLEKAIDVRIVHQVDPSGQPWKPLAEATLAARRRHKPPILGNEILVATGQMRDSLAHNEGDDFLEVGFSRATPGGEWEVAMLSEWGTTRGMPRRGLLTADPQSGTLGAQDQEAILTVIATMVLQAF